MRAPTLRKQISRSYRVLLGREPTLDELRSHVSANDSLRDVVNQLVGLEDYPRNLRAPRDPRWRGALAGSAVAEEAVPPGTVSPDGRAIAGKDGFVFICGGLNSPLRQFEGTMPMEPPAISQWQEAIEFREASAARLGVALACLVVPDKLALLPDKLPTELPVSARRPIEELLEAVPDVFVYPVDSLRDAREKVEVTYRTDSHLSLHGAQLVYRSLMEKFNLRPTSAALNCEHNEVLRSSALGKSFDPFLYDVQDIPIQSPEAYVQTNEREVGLHRGVVRTSVDPTAEIQAKIVVVGDSYCLPWRSGQLGCLIERSFSEAHFLWSAMGWDEEYISRVEPDFVLLEMAERFVIRPPAMNVKIDEVAAQANRTRRRKAKRNDSAS